MNHQQQHLISTTTPIDQDSIKDPTIQHHSSPILSKTQSIHMYTS